jgi:glycosyltransferase involved in cell wall biosynthesis
MQLQIGVDEREIALSPISREQSEGSSPYRILYAGRHVHWKEMELGLRAFGQLLQSCPNVSLSLTAEGPATIRWKAIAVELGVANRIVWLGWGKYEGVLRIYLYRGHHALLFPSLHEAAGMHLLEAFAAGLPVVCFNLGGPGVLVDDRVGRGCRCIGYDLR